MWDVVGLAEAVKRGLGTGEPAGGTLRLVRQFIMDLEGSDVPEEMFREEPPSTGDRRWDALIAGVIEDFTFHRGIEQPAWLFEEGRFLPTWWFLTSIDSMRPTAIVQAPAALANRGVFVQRASLVNA